MSAFVVSGQLPSKHSVVLLLTHDRHSRYGVQYNCSEQESIAGVRPYRVPKAILRNKFQVLRKDEKR